MEILPKPIFRNLQPLVLASESARRVQLLRSLGVDIEVIPSGIEEGNGAQQEPAFLVESLARE
ncbi:MAG TPA: Maf family protein, partial [Syntrophobacteraceae bacterium]|nr:Maf family protein [Syntrophobacteraceae bacterium]